MFKWIKSEFERREKQLLNYSFLLQIENFFLVLMGTVTEFIYDLYLTTSQKDLSRILTRSGRQAYISSASLAKNKQTKTPHSQRKALVINSFFRLDQLLSPSLL